MMLHYWVTKYLLIHHYRICEGAKDVFLAYDLFLYSIDIILRK